MFIDPQSPPPLAWRAVIDVVFPVLDEAEALPWVLARVPTGYRAIVIDNGSRDGSGAIARELGATVVEERQRGFGAACWRGLQESEADVVAFCDADASLDPAHLPLVTGPIEAGHQDLVLGRRCPTGPGVWPAHARVANRYLARRVGRVTGVTLTDLGPMRAATRSPLLALDLQDRRFGWPLEMVMRAARSGWRIAETDVPYLPRQGRSKVTGTARGTIRTVRDMRRVLSDRT